MDQTGFCAHPSPGSHAYCDTLVKDGTKAVKCSCACHEDMAPFEELDARLREQYARPGSFSIDGVADDDDEEEPVLEAAPEAESEKPKHRRAPAKKKG